MAQYKLTVSHNGQERTLFADTGESMLDTLRNAGYSGIHAPCGGNGTCKQCKVSVIGSVFTVSNPSEIQQLEGNEVLACRIQAAMDCTVLIPDTEAMEVVTSGAGNIDPCGEGLGVAVDIGTTTVAAFLYDLETGERLAIESGRNSQRPFGADVISRIQYSDQPGGLHKLAAVIRAQLDDAISALCKTAARSRDDITRVSIAGNTVMQHILAELSPVTIGIAPFITLSLFGDVRPAADMFSGLAENAELYIAPALAGYVGGDITAGLLSSGAWQSIEPCLFIDIGTNGEMGIGDKSGYTCCATAAGPAFEGAEIECGMDGSAGAISRVRWVDDKIEYDVIGDVEATGICGSGLIDALACMLRCGAVEESGRMVPPDEAPANIAHHIKRVDEKTRFYFTDTVFVSAEDVRQLQLAKSAIRAGIETLMVLRELSYDDIDAVIIAGGFGAYMDVRSACTIGLLPPAMVDKTRHVGNAAGAGAVMALDHDVRGDLTQLKDICDYHELSSSALFMEKYIECMIFDEADLVEV